jgi:calcium binding protein 39
MTENSGPFEWLSGGLFFGKKGGGIEGIDSCKDVMTLITGIDENLKEICLQGSTAAQTAATEGDSTGKQHSPEKFLAARSSRLRFLLYEERRITSQQGEHRKTSPQVASSTAAALTQDSLSHLVPRLLDNLGALPFESRKHVASIVNYLLVCGLEGQDRALYAPSMNAFTNYVASRYDEIISTLVKGHDTELHGGQADCALHCGSMLRSCLRHVSLYRELTITTERTQRLVFPFLDKYVHLPNFDVSSDAMETLRIIFTGGASTEQKHYVMDPQSQQFMSEIAATFLTRDYDAIWVQRFPVLLTETAANYMTRRMALQILSTVLLTRTNYAVMIQYVAERRNLVLVMKLLRDTSPHISLDAFHVFKVFVANPNKPAEIVKILQDNKEKLCRYLETLHRDREDVDTQFRDEKALIIATIEAL